MVKKRGRARRKWNRAKLLGNSFVSISHTHMTHRVPVPVIGGDASCELVMSGGCWLVGAAEV